MPISWDDAFKLIAQHLHALDHPDQAAFYTSGRASNEAAFYISYLYEALVQITFQTVQTCAMKPQVWVCSTRLV